MTEARPLPVDPGGLEAGRPEVVRTCVGCRRRESARALVRWVLGADGAVSVDLERRKPGRGAWTHPDRNCLEGAARGFRRALRTDQSADAAALREALVSAAGARFRKLIEGGRRARKVVADEAGVEAAVRSGASRLLVVACDAPDVLGRPWVREAIGRGAAMAWGTAADLGPEKAVERASMLAVLDDGLAVALSGLPAPGSSTPPPSMNARSRSLNSEVG